MSQRFYSEDEVAKILQLATEKQAKEQKTAFNNIDGLSLEEILVAGSSAGINPEMLKQAAAEIDTRESETAIKSKKGVKAESIYVERWLQTIPDKQTIQSLVAMLNHETDGSNEWWSWFKPKVKVNGKIVEWKSSDTYGSYETRIVMQPVGGRYRIRISKRNTWGGGWKGYTLTWHIFLALAAAGLLVGSYFLELLWPAIAIIALVYYFLVPVINNADNRYINKHLSELDEMADDIQEMILVQGESYSSNQYQERQGSEIDIEIEEIEPGPLKNQLRKKSKS